MSICPAHDHVSGTYFFNNAPLSPQRLGTERSASTQTRKKTPGHWRAAASTGCIPDVSNRGRTDKRTCEYEIGFLETERQRALERCARKTKEGDEESHVREYRTSALLEHPGGCAIKSMVISDNVCIVSNYPREPIDLETLLISMHAGPSPPTAVPRSFSPALLTHYAGGPRPRPRPNPKNGK